MSSEFYESCRPEDLVKYCVEKDTMITKLCEVIEIVAGTRVEQLNLPIGVKL